VRHAVRVKACGRFYLQRRRGELRTGGQRRRPRRAHAERGRPLL